MQKQLLMLESDLSDYGDENDYIRDTNGIEPTEQSGSIIVKRKLKNL
jgi:hypothetical protein